MLCLLEGYIKGIQIPKRSYSENIYWLLLIQKVAS